jgi:hypothetical protein
MIFENIRGCQHFLAFFLNRDDFHYYLELKFQVMASWTNFFVELNSFIFWEHSVLFFDKKKEIN